MNRLRGIIKFKYVYVDQIWQKKPKKKKKTGISDYNTTNKRNIPGHDDYYFFFSSVSALGNNEVMKVMDFDKTNKTI